MPDYELIREGDAQLVANSTIYPAGYYLSVSNPSRCTGIASSLEICAELRNITPSAVYRLNVYLFRDKNNFLHEQIGIEAFYSTRQIQERLRCVTRDLDLTTGWTVEKGDVVGVEILTEECLQKRDPVCPLHAVFSPTMITPNHTLDYIATTPNPGLIPITAVTATPGFVNARVSIGEIATQYNEYGYLHFKFTVTILQFLLHPRYLPLVTRYPPHPPVWAVCPRKKVR